MRVGILALQGDFAAHARALQARGVESIEVRTPEDLCRLDGLVLPGGESTTMLKLLEGSNLTAGLRELVTSGTPVLATCAGVILIAREVENPPQASLGLLDVVVARNAYGRQIDSAVIDLAADESGLGVSRLEGVFIRAPRITACGPAVRPLAWRDGVAVLVEEDAILAATFHPELSVVSPVVDRFVARVRSRAEGCNRRLQEGLSYPEPSGQGITAGRQN